MRSKTKVIIAIISVFSILFLAFFGITFYSIYQYGEKNGLLEEEDSRIDKEQYQKEKEAIEQKKQRLQAEREVLNKQYVNKEITYEEYLSKKQEIELLEEDIDLNENDFERKYGGNNE